jgi:hypothetical protein
MKQQPKNTWIVHSSLHFLRNNKLEIFTLAFWPIRHLPRNLNIVTTPPNLYLQIVLQQFHVSVETDLTLFVADFWGGVSGKIFA